MKRALIGISLAAASMMGSALASAQKALKEAFIDPLSGPIAGVGEPIYAHGRIRAKPGKKMLAGVRSDVQFVGAPLTSSDSTNHFSPCLPSARCAARPQPDFQ